MQFLGLCGSLRAQSTNRRLLHAFAGAAPAGTTVTLHGSLGVLPIFSPDLEAQTPRPVLDLAGAVGACDGLLIACPEYAHGIPGGLKNALDWLVSRFEIPGKPVMLVHASVRSLTAREHLREVLRTMSCRVHPGPEYELHLIGRQTAEIDTLLRGERSRMAAVLGDFARFAGEAGH
jgi:NAD(P)H-dependent FMN reductase